MARPLQTLSNLLGALREEDFSFRARVGRRDDPLGQALVEVNALAQMLREQRLGALEATALLRKVMEEIDVAVFAFDAGSELQLLNRAGERLLGRALRAARRPRRRGARPRAVPDGRGHAHRRRGVPGRRRPLRHAAQQLPPARPAACSCLVLADVSRALRDEERQAWQRLIRVIGHELNNSLAPIRSSPAASSRCSLREPRPADWEDDMRRGLSRDRRARGVAARASWTPTRGSRGCRRRRGGASRSAPLLRRVAGLETRVQVAVNGGREVAVEADPDQLEQLLINLVRNAADAAPGAPSGVRLSWSLVEKPAPAVEIRVDDDGPGLPPSANLFVPFFTTKPGGSGIGLVLCRQIAEAHGGTLTLANRSEGGCRAALVLRR